MVSCVFCLLTAVTNAAVLPRTITSSGFTRSYAYTSGSNGGNAIISMTGNGNIGAGRWCNYLWTSELSNNNFMVVCLNGLQWDDDLDGNYDDKFHWLPQLKADSIMPDSRIPSGVDRDTDLIFIKDVIQDIKSKDSITDVYINGFSGGCDMTMNLYFTDDLPNSADDSFQSYIDTEVGGVTIKGYGGVSRGIRTEYDGVVPNDLVPFYYQYGTNDPTELSNTDIKSFADTKTILENAQGCNTQTSTQDATICRSKTKQSFNYATKSCDELLGIQQLAGVAHKWTRCFNYKTEKKIVRFFGL